MRLLPSDPDVETIISRIDAKDLNLQPDFQRGEVWSRAKKQRLVDSILRDWHVPPIHVIELTGSRLQEVLDGQQRLVAIRDFARGDFSIDGNIEPFDQRIANLDGKKFRELPDDARRQFNQFTIRFFRIVDYKSDEPAELFFRLNQPTNLTAAEQRNAFFGHVRQQIKDLVLSLELYGLDKSFLGFSNSRMAYDDVLSRVALTVERGTISDKISSSDLVELYRSENRISQTTIDIIDWALKQFAVARRIGGQHPRFNKATLYSWLIFLARTKTTAAQKRELSGEELAAFMEFFEHSTIEVQIGIFRTTKDVSIKTLDWMYSTYQDRSTSRVSDVSSVMLRDLVIWFIYSVFRSHSTSIPLQDSVPDKLKPLLLRPDIQDADIVAKEMSEVGWGELR